MDADRARAFRLLDVPIAVRELLDVAVEVQADDFAVSVDDGRTGIAADRVGGVDESSAASKIDLLLSRS